MNHAIPYRADIDGLRALAVVSVVLFHAFPEFFPGGYVGVDIFFVISGYLISSIIYKENQVGKFSIVNFYVRRAKRIFPSLLLVLVSVFLLGFLTLIQNEFQYLGKHIFSGAFFVSNFALFSESGYFDVSSNLKPLLHLWSLSIEEQFYIAWPLIVSFLFRRKMSLKWSIIILFSTSFLANVLLIQEQKNLVFYFPVTRAWELLMGCYLGWLSFTNDKIRFPSTSLLSFVGATLMIAPVFFLRSDSSFPGHWALLPTTGAVLYISGGAGSGVNRFFSSRVLVRLGLISYPLYLWHWPLLSLLKINSSSEPGYLMVTLAIGVSLLLSWLTYYFLERPIRQGVFSFSEKKFALGVSGALFSFGLFGGVVKLWPEFVLRFQGEELKTYGQIFIAPPVADTDCPKYFGFRAGDYCNWDRSKGQPKVALIGDSHSNAIYSGVKKYFDDRHTENLIQVGHGGCPYLLGVESENKTSVQKGCKDRTQKVLEKIGNDKQVGKVILHGRWSIYASDKGYGMEKFDWRLTSHTHPSLKSNVEVFEKGLEDTIEFYLSHHKQVYFIHSVPEFFIEPKSCSSRPLNFDSVLPKQQCSISVQKLSETQMRYRIAVNNVLTKFPKVVVFDPLPYFCSPELCSAYLKGISLFKDNSHLNLQGSLYFASKLKF